MNDFTKEELEFILDGTRHWSNQNIPTPWVFEFKKKVESMIDNYCEHEELTQKMGNATYFKGVCKHCNKEKGF